MSKVEEFLELVKANPNLPIVPMVYSEVVCDDGYCYWVGSFGNAHIDEYVCVPMYGEDRFFTRDQQDEIEETFANEIANDDLSGEFTEAEIERLAHQKAEALPWIKAIIVYVELPEMDYEEGV